MTSYGDAKRVASAHADLPGLIERNETVSLVLIDDDHREQRPIQGQVIRLGPDSLIFRHQGIDEEISLAVVAKRVLGDDVVTY